MTNQLLVILNALLLFLFVHDLHHPRRQFLLASPRCTHNTHKKRAIQQKKGQIFQENLSALIPNPPPKPLPPAQTGSWGPHKGKKHGNGGGGSARCGGLPYSHTPFNRDRISRRASWASRFTLMLTMCCMKRDANSNKGVGGKTKELGTKT